MAPYTFGEAERGNRLASRRRSARGASGRALQPSTRSEAFREPRCAAISALSKWLVAPAWPPLRHYVHNPAFRPSLFTASDMQLHVSARTLEAGALGVAAPAPTTCGEVAGTRRMYADADDHRERPAETQPEYQHHEQLKKTGGHTEPHLRTPRSSPSALMTRRVPRA